MLLVTVTRMEEHLNYYYLILSLSMKIKDIPVELPRIGFTLAICEKCTFIIKLELNRIPWQKVPVLTNFLLGVSSPFPEIFLSSPSGLASFASSAK